LATSRKTSPVSLFSPNFLVILSTRWASCKDVLCLDLNPNCSSRINPRSLTSCKILSNRIFSNSLPIVSNKIAGVFIREKVWLYNSLTQSEGGGTGMGRVQVEKQAVESKDAKRRPVVRMVRRNGALSE